MAARLPTFYLSHGGGPWPYMGGEFRRRHAALEAALEALPRQLTVKPAAVLVVSGHWEEADFAVMASPAPPTVYDFGGFPPELYRIRYAACGSPALAQQVCDLVRKAGLPTQLDAERGFDHGTYSLLAVMYPNADVPVIQVSMRADYDPEAHLRLGRALAPLRKEGVLIVGSGSSYHNMLAFQGRYRGDARAESSQFDGWLQQTLVEATPAQRSERLLRWEAAPHARAVHPREDHLMPLHVAVGAAEGEPGQVVYRQPDFFGAISLSSYRFG